MAEDWEDFEDEDEWDDDDELSPEDLADIKREEQDANMGFGYETVFDEVDGVKLRCMKCKRMAGLGERPFPHKFDCPMRARPQEED